MPALAAQAATNRLAPRYLALGDSYTIGEGVVPEACWPALLAAALRAAAVALADPEIVATTGWTTDELAAAMDRAALRPPYDLISLLIGVNDQYRGRDLDGYRRGFTQLLGRAIDLAGGRARRVLALSIPDWGVTPFARAQNRDSASIAAEIDAFNAVNHAVAAAHDVAWINVTAISRALDATEGMLVADGLHPSAVQYARWTERILPAARVALTTP